MMRRTSQQLQEGSWTSYPLLQNKAPYGADVSHIEVMTGHTTNPNLP